MRISFSTRVCGEGSSPGHFFLRESSEEGALWDGPEPQSLQLVLGTQLVRVLSLLHSASYSHLALSCRLGRSWSSAGAGTKTFILKWWETFPAWDRVLLLS